MLEPETSSNRETSGSKLEPKIEIRKVDRLGPTQVRLTVAYPAEIVRRQEQSTAQKYASQAKIPGFRPGKAPMKMVFERFGAEIRRDIVSALLQKGVWEAVEETKLIPVNQPEISWDGELLGDKPLEFKIEFEVQPEVKVDHYLGVPLEPLNDTPTEEEINKTFDGLRDRFATLEPSDLQKPEKGAYAVVDVGYQLLSDPSVKEENQALTVEIGTGNLLPGLEEAIEKLAIGESTQVESQFPTEYNNPKLAGQKANFDLKLVELKKKNLPALDDAFANQLREGNTYEALHKEVVESVQEQKRSESRREQRRKIVDYLIDRNSFAVPKSMVDKQTERIAASVADDFKRQGQAAPNFSEDEMSAIRGNAERSVKSSLILGEIAKKENLQVDEARVKQRIKAIADQWNRPESEIEKMLQGRGMLEEIRREILTDQVFDFLFEKSTTARSGK